MSPHAGAALEAEDIEFSYGRLQILFGISIRLAAGECLALLGTNGAGKSTLLRVLCGLEPPSHGTVRLQGRDVTGVATENLVGQGLVLVAGGRGVFPDMTVADNLEMQSLAIRRDHRLVAERLEAVMEAFPVLRARFRQPAGSMSGGEQQQLALAKALLLSPAVLCLDELSLGLAPVVVEQLIDVVKGINALGTSVILVEQSLNIASLLCERAVFLEKGKVSFEGRTADLMERGDIARAVFLGGARS